jgi:hypothetical protein
LSSLQNCGAVFSFKVHKAIYHQTVKSFTSLPGGIYTAYSEELQGILKTDDRSHKQHGIDRKQLRQ